jgi:hypothetical protein
MNLKSSFCLYSGNHTKSRKIKNSFYYSGIKLKENEINKFIWKII